MKVTALAGGVGGAKLAHGLSQVLPAEDLTVIVNTGDDFEHWGLRICPDIDTVCYTLAGMANPQTGWGRAGDTFQALENVTRLGGSGWFGLGDQDLGTHLERTRRLKDGEPLSRITLDFCARWGVQVKVLPMTDDPLATWVDTEEMGVLPFQEYFVRYGFQPRVKGFHFVGEDTARMAPGVEYAITRADTIVVCPSNPWVSIGPILHVRGLRDLLAQKNIAAVSPIVGGAAIKGPAAKMYQELGIHPSALSVAKQYQDWVNGFVMDEIDVELREKVESLGLVTLVTNTIMNSKEDRRELAMKILEFCGSLMRNPLS